MKKTPKPREVADLNEAVIATLRIALGGDFAKQAISDIFRHQAAVLGRTLSIDEFAELLSFFLTVISDSDCLKKDAGTIVMGLAMDLAAGRPVDDRVRPLGFLALRVSEHPPAALALGRDSSVVARAPAHGPLRGTRKASTFSNVNG